MKLLVTGGSGFIGSNFVRFLHQMYPDELIVNLDLLTYAGSNDKLEDLKHSNYHFVKGNIGDQTQVGELFGKYDFDTVINFAAESHVDNSIKGPRVFVETNVYGTMNLLDCAHRHWKGKKGWQEKNRFIQISTDEVYGSLDENDTKTKFTETTLMNPSNPYSASKAGADVLVGAYHHTFKFPAIITRCSNNYGPRQYPEKFVPLMIKCAMKDKKLPIYGDGKNIRDWIYVEDHCRAVDMVLRKGRLGEIYNIGGNNEHRNIDIAKSILKQLGKPESLISFVEDRMGHDRRYAMDSSKLRSELSWRAQHEFDQSLKTTVEWYRDHAS